MSLQILARTIVVLTTISALSPFKANSSELIYSGSSSQIFTGNAEGILIAQDDHGSSVRDTHDDHTLTPPERDQHHKPSSVNESNINE